MSSGASLHPRTLLTFVLDVSAPMGQTDEGETQTRLAQCQAFIAMRLLEVMMRGLATIKVCIFIYGAERTDHILCEKGILDDYLGIVELWRPAPPTLDTIDLVQALTPGTTHGTPCDPIDGLVVTLATILDKDRGVPSSWTRLVYLVTRTDAVLNIGDTDVVRQRLAQSDTPLRVLHVGPTTPPTETWQFQETFWRDMISEVPGSAMAPAAQVAAQSMEPHIQMPKSHPIAATLTFGQPGTSQHACLSLPVRLWKATAHQRPPSTTRLAKGEAPASERRVEAHPLLYKVEDILQAGDDLHHVQPLPDTTPVQRAYKLGASLVPLHHTLPPLDTTPAMEILHFVHAKTYRREYHLGETYYVTAPTTSTRAQVALSSLVQAAAVKGVYALCRWVPRAQAEPKLYILAPLVESEYDGFYMVRVPFREDVKRVAFPPLDRIVTQSGEAVYEHATIPTASQQEAMDAWVDQMDLMDMDDENDEEGWYAPPLSYNPAIHGIKNAIKHRFLYPMTPLPPLPASLTRFLTTPSPVEARARPARDACAVAFECAPGPSTRPRKPPSEAPKTEAPSVVAAEAATPPAFEPLAPVLQEDRIDIPHVGPLRFADLIHDFEALVNDTQAVTEVCTAMSMALLHLVAQPATTVPTLIRALHAFRHVAAEALLYNAFLRTFWAEAHTQSHTQPLVQVLRHRLDLGLITHDEDAAHRSTETPATARALAEWSTPP